MKNVEIPKWLEGLPLAPEFHPTDTEFADPIAYIAKIEKEAGAFGICKVIPPLPKPSRKYVLHNLNRSLLKNPELGSGRDHVTPAKTNTVVRDSCDGGNKAVFTTRQQELGCGLGKRMKAATGEQMFGAQKQVWQSGEVYTLEQFEAKSKNFARSQLGVLKEINPLAIESMFWKAAAEKPIFIEYANDVPGSGFGEPERLLHYFQKRRRRKRNSFDRNVVGTTDSNNDNVDSVNSSKTEKDSGSRNNHNLCTVTALNSLPSAGSHQGSSFTGQNYSNCSNEMEGTAGWKLSNSPWNLQVIARSPGSLTRFMPDDIPGVTSPMVYIGMLFSWFAWHVEDHELHSLNYLHIGSPKTWYAVPGDYAFNFEEVICRNAYGGKTDRLDALSRLGEKTTVLSPEVIAASGIPCCRLVQYPGEFVVTFPRAYHIGFSHGFNCGEAANFGTPKWLAVAKEAAIRRAAMNYLPMLSHQQLLYLLTMSFISRIPRSLLPGVRSSRLRDRQKEEREISVKKAFIQDILHENNLMNILVQRNPSYRAVLWDLEFLPSSNKESCKDVNAAASTSTEKVCPVVHNRPDHVSHLNNYMCSVGFDINDDDLAYDFQIDSGALPCVSCGILGFPFMAVIQPSEVASKALLLENAGSFTEANKAKLNMNNLCHVSEASSVAEVSQSTHSRMEESPAVNYSSPFNHEASYSKVEIVEGWNISTSFLRPRIFCLEHAIQIEKLLNSKGGANVLLICHSDFQKIKAHTAVVAEEISCHFHYNEIPLADASPEDQNVIDIAISSHEQVFCADWTTQLNINLQHYVKVKKSAPLQNFRYLLTLGGLLCGENLISCASNIKWQSRKIRSKRIRKHASQEKTNDSISIQKEDLETYQKPEVAEEEVKIIQYSRKRYKSSVVAGIDARAITGDLVVQDILHTNCDNPAKEEKGPSDLASHGKSEMQTEARSISPMNEAALEDKNDSLFHDSLEYKANGSIKKTVRCFTGNSVSSDLHDLGKGCASEIGSGIDESVEASETGPQMAEGVSEMLQDVQSDGNEVIKDTFIPTGSSNYSDDGLSPKCDELTESMHNASDFSNSSTVQENAVSRRTASINESSSDSIGQHAHDDEGEIGNVLEKELDYHRTKAKLVAKKGSRRKSDVSLENEDQLRNFIRSPCEGLRPRAKKDNAKQVEETEEQNAERLRKSSLQRKVPPPHKKRRQKGRYECDIDFCTVSFQTKSQLVLHKGNQCPVQGCKKKFNSHKYLLQHQRVHDDDRPLKCPWKDCTMSFKWAWARTEHIRVHTGERPYACKVKGCGLTFRFISDFSRHRRKTGHCVKTPG